MTRKHYIKIAKQLKDARRSPDVYDENHRYHLDLGFNLGLDKAAEELCDLFKSDNPSFDRDRFLTAAGVQA